MNVLVVDDEVVSRLALSGVVRALGCSPVEASDGQQAWELLEGEKRFDLCCSDVLMPRVGGLSLLQRVRTHPVLADLPFVLVSSASDCHTVTSAIRNGAAAYLRKPFSAADVRATITRVLRAAQAEQAEAPEQTQERLRIDGPNLRKLLHALRDVVSRLLGGAGRDANTDRLGRLHKDCLTLGLWRAANQLERAMHVWRPDMQELVLRGVLACADAQAEALGATHSAKAEAGAEA